MGSSSTRLTFESRLENRQYLATILFLFIVLVLRPFTISHVSPTLSPTPSLSPCPYPPTNSTFSLPKTQPLYTAPSKLSSVSIIPTSSPSTSVTATPSPSSSTKRNLVANRTEFQSAEEALFAARDNIVEAYKLTSDRDLQTQILDFLNIFREYIEQQDFKSLPLQKKPSNNIKAPLNIPSTKDPNTRPSQSHNNLRDSNSIRDPRQSFAQVLAKAPAKSNTSPLLPLQKTGSSASLNKDSLQEKKVITIVITKGSSVPVHQPT
ncbi:hypothetical protein K3495_g4936 [Podosphaera aphanis]|nr:hypothetical protein K3495_g4936 [Podosphaera aphanis]